MALSRAFNKSGDFLLKTGWVSQWYMHTTQSYMFYQELALKEPNVIFVGRLASYKYFNMDEAIKTALELYDKLLPSIFELNK